MRRSRRILFWLLLGLLVLASLELASHAVMFLLRDDPRFAFTPIERRLREQTDLLRDLLAPSEGRLLQLDPELGWIYAPSVSAGPYTSTAQGVRGTRLYPARRSAGMLRLAAFGDSFVHANEVSDEEAWSRRLELLDERFEVLNFGVGGHGTDQALLLYRRRGAEPDPDVVILGFTEVAAARNVNRYRRFRAVQEMPLFKPRFLLGEGGALDLLPNPFSDPAAARRVVDDPWAILEVAPHDWFFEPLVWHNPLYDRVAFVRLASSVASKVWQSRLRHDRFYEEGLLNSDAEWFELQVGLIREFAREVGADGARFLLVAFPRNPPDLWGSAPRAYQPLLDALDDHWVVDLADSLGPRFRSEPEALFAPGGHYSAAGNEVVAETLQRALRDRGL